MSTFALSGTFAPAPRSRHRAQTSASGKLFHQRPLAPAYWKFFRAPVEQHRPALLAVLDVRFLETAYARFCRQAIAVDAHEGLGEFLLQVRERFLQQVLALGGADGDVLQL